MSNRTDRDKTIGEQVIDIEAAVAAGRGFSNDSRITGVTEKYPDGVGPSESSGTHPDFTNIDEIREDAEKRKKAMKNKAGGSSGNVRRLFAALTSIVR